MAALRGTTGGVKELEGKGGNAEQSSRVQADGHAVTGAFLRHDPTHSPESKVIGGAIQQNVEKVKRANPVQHATKDAPPFFIAHGEQDPLVPGHQSEELYEALKKAEVEVTFEKIPGAGHGGKEFGTDKMQAAIQEFFDKHSKPKPDGKAKNSSQSK